jgi:SAM-dependent methyltransferase
LKLKKAKLTQAQLDTATQSMMNPSKKLWTRETILEFLERERPGYQKILLPHGLETGGVDRPQIKEIAFDNIRGKSLLDIGSCYGGFCVDALQRGASKAVGIELSRRRIQAAQTIAEILDLHPDYRLEDVERLRIGETFDVTICLDVLHHLRDPLGVLRQLADVTNERLILEVASAGAHDRKKLKIGSFRGRLLASMPAVLVGPYNPNILRQTFFFTESAMKTILGEHRRIFHTVRVVKSQFKERFIVVADKLRIKRMVLVCGLTSSGKSTFIETLQKSNYAKQLTQIHPQSIRVGANGITRRPLSQIFPTTQCDSVIYHYDLSRKETLNTYSYDRDIATDIVSLSANIDVVIVAPKLPILQQQLRTSELSRPSDRIRKKHLQLEELYEDKHWVCSMYCDFIDFCSTSCRGITRFTIYTGGSGEQHLLSVKGAEEAKAIMREIYMT